MVSNTLTKNEIRERVKRINAIYNEAMVKLRVLRKKQNQIITDFIDKLNKKRMEEIRNKIKNS